MRLFSFTVSIFILFVAPSYAAEPVKPRVEVNLRHNNKHSIKMSEFWVPIWQDEYGVLYGDIRIMGDNKKNNEYNAGLGYRQLLNNSFLGHGIAGVHIWFDRRHTANNNSFNQITSGLEWKGEKYDVLLNSYLPLNSEQNFTRANPNGTNVRFTGNQIVVNTNQALTEEALIGADLEIGLKLDFMDVYTDSTRLYAGAYHFEGKQSEDVSGWRARVASDITPNLQLGARFQRDEERGSQGFLEATLRFPFDNKKSFKSDGLRARLDESPERDIDIVSNEAVIDDGMDKPLFNAQTGKTQTIIHVNNTAAGGGNGTASNPYNTLAAAQAAAGSNALIYVHRGDGTSAGQNVGITLDDEGQKLIGAGANLTLSNLDLVTSNGLGLGDTNILIAVNPLGAPVITNGGGNGIDITADNIVVKGINITAATGIGVRAYNNSGTSWRGLSVENVTVSNSGDTGIQLHADGAGSSITNTTFNTITSTANAGRGVYIFAENSGSIDDITLKDINSNNNTGIMGRGLNLHATGAGSTISNITAYKMDIDGNADRGVYVYANSSAQISDIVFDTVTSNNNLGGNGRGFQIWAAGGTVPSITGVRLYKVTASGNQSRGIYVYADNNGIIGVSIENSNFINNSDTGVFFDDDTSGTFTADIGGGSLGSAGGNSIHSNTGADIRVDLDGGELKAENNWWGISTGLDAGERTLESGSSIDFNPYLSTAP